jgi:hypothetical protein
LSSQVIQPKSMSDSIKTRRATSSKWCFSCEEKEAGLSGADRCVISGCADYSIQTTAGMHVSISLAFVCRPLTRCVCAVGADIRAGSNCARSRWRACFTAISRCLRRAVGSCVRGGIWPGSTARRYRPRPLSPSRQTMHRGSTPPPKHLRRRSLSRSNRRAVSVQVPAHSTLIP